MEAGSRRAIRRERGEDEGRFAEIRLLACKMEEMKDFFRQ
jgi:hypothetical protein